MKLVFFEKRVKDEIKSKILDSTISDELSSSTSTTPI